MYTPLLWDTPQGVADAGTACGIAGVPDNYGLVAAHPGE